MKNLIFISLVMAFCMACNAQGLAEKEIVKNKMKVSWHYEGDRIFFEMSAPTDGWVTIGFNTNSGIKGAYLLMGNVVKGELQVVEHYTISPGNYKALSALGETAQVKAVAGEESSNRTTLKFSLPVKANSKYQKDLSEGNGYTMIMSYSQEDDFEHHSIMRTSASVKL